jgi:DNA-directed RNA polymerase specialized sigma24 family protein
MVQPEHYLGVAKRVAKDLKRYARHVGVEPEDFYAQIRLHLVEACDKLNFLREDDPEAQGGTVGFLLTRVKWDTISWLRHEDVVGRYHVPDIVKNKDGTETTFSDIRRASTSKVDLSGQHYPNDVDIYKFAEVGLFLDWAVNNLPENYARWCIMYYTQGYQAKEIAKEFNVGTTAVSTALHRAVKRYKGRFKQPKRIVKRKIHGTVNKYNTGCRCAKCKEAKAQYWRSKNAKQRR